MLLSNYKILKVLLDGLHDPESSLNMLREPNDVRRPVMEMIWGQVTEDWQVCVILAIIGNIFEMKRLCHLILIRPVMAGVRRRRFFLFGFLFIDVEEKIQ